MRGSEDITTILNQISFADNMKNKQASVSKFVLINTILH